MAKASHPGRTKTRLVPPLTSLEAATFNTAFLKDVAANIGMASRHGAVRGYMAYGPPGSQWFFEENLPADIGLIEAWFPSFGDCLFKAIEDLLASHGSAVVLNSDSPTLPNAILVRTANLLAASEDCAVLGPSTDGGYYLLGLKRPHRRLFEDIDWSTDRVAQQTLQRAQEIGLNVHQLPAWYDVDDANALRQLHAELFEGQSLNAALTPHRASHTSLLIAQLLETSDLRIRLGLSRTSGERLAV
jgi:rSAM/selenodomain-associated transferase 1